MSYLALARKWRPRKFADVVGQDHIVRALQNALERNQVHHAYLLGGTRGVGKTTIARLLAKALNCDAPVAAEPCGTCSACVSIDEGRFVDLIEVDAASRTKVEQTRELLENVQYTPSSGKYKVYLIDEVHMLSKSSFNALLKTLEEPPPHVKFLLATTDPQDLPLTVLSRCLQFNLKRLSAALILERLEFICVTEQIEREPGALMLLAKAADGSMRDGLSLLDQALAFGAGKLDAAEVAAMLGTLNRQQLGAILRCLCAGDAAALLQQLQDLHALVPDYGGVLDEIATVFQQLALLQLAGEGGLDDEADPELLAELAAQVDAELVQLWYQIAITGRRDLSMAPQPRTGFEMTLLRMLAFQPAAVAPVPVSGGNTAHSKAKTSGSAALTANTDGEAAAMPVATGSPAIPDWPSLVAQLPLRGATLQLARSCVPTTGSAGSIALQIESCHEYLLLDTQQAQLREALSDYFRQSLKLVFEVVSSPVDTLSRRDQGAIARRIDDARKTIESDPVVRQVIDTFGARLDPDSIRPVDQESKH